MPVWLAAKYAEERPSAAARRRPLPASDAENIEMPTLWLSSPMSLVAARKTAASPVAGVEDEIRRLGPCVDHI